MVKLITASSASSSRTPRTQPKGPQLNGGTTTTNPLWGLSGRNHRKCWSVAVHQLIFGMENEDDEMISNQMHTLPGCVPVYKLALVICIVVLQDRRAHVCIL